VTAGSLDVTVVLPCFNEQEHVLAEIDRISSAMDASGFSYELMVIDDKSTDSTLAVIRSAQVHYPRMRIIAFRRNGGSGTARRIGTTDAFGKIVVWTDADMTYPNERIPEFVQYLLDNPDVDQVVGARTSEQGTHKYLRVPAKWAIRKIAETLSSTTIPDLNSGLRAFRREVSLPYLRLLPPGFSCVTTITLSFLSNQHGVEYLPIDYAQRSGTSKFHFVRDAYRYILQVLRMVMYFNPIKVLMPLALWIFGIGVVKGIVDLVRYHLRITTNSVLLILTGLIIGAIALLADLIVRSRAEI
jgi:glycosyltransferase involved in cell wall biosynthesis